MTHEERPPLARPRSPTALAAAAAGLLCLALAALVAASLSQIRSEVWATARGEGRNLTEAIAAEVGRTVELVDLAVQAAAEAMTLPELADAAPAVRRAAVLGRAANARGLATLLVLDAFGDVVLSSREDPPRRTSYADRDYFAVHRADPAVGLHVGRPVHGRGAGGWFVTVSRRIAAPDGGFAGVVVAGLDLSAWRQTFERLEIGSGGTVTLVRTDGAVVLRTPFSEADLGRSLQAGPVFRRMQDAPAGQFVQLAALDGVERLYTYRRIEGTPLMVATGFATADVAARWRRQAAVVLAAGAACLALVLGAGAALLWELRRRRAAEAALGAANAELERAAATDALTGLPNRRAFDERLRREWRRAARQGRPVSLLVVDVDHFKRFNDLFGHPAGDECLRRVAEALRLVARRPGDLAARVGGEEFALLMPDTDEDGARHMAGRLAEAVHAAAVPHPGNAPAGIVTLSAGGATARPGPGLGAGPHVLVAAADRALYSAKDTGRNRAAWAPSPESEPAAGN